MEHGFYHPDHGYWQAIDISDDVDVIEVEPERVERDDSGNEVVIPAVVRETTQLAELLASYPPGTIEVPLKPGADHEWQDGAWVHVPPPLDPLKAALKARLDADAETERLKYVTPGAGQAMEYQQAATEADALLTAIADDPNYDPDPAHYPMLAASLGIDGGTLAEVAATVSTMHGQWRQIGSAIRAVRLAGKQAIDAAATAEDAQAAFDAVEWPNPA